MRQQQADRHMAHQHSEDISKQFLGVGFKRGEERRGGGDGHEEERGGGEGHAGREHVGHEYKEHDDENDEGDDYGVEMGYNVNGQRMGYNEHSHVSDEGEGSLLPSRIRDSDRYSLLEDEEEDGKP